MCIEPRPKMGLGWHRLCTGFRDEKSVAIREHRGVYNGRVTETGIEAGAMLYLVCDGRTMRRGIKV